MTQRTSLITKDGLMFNHGAFYLEIWWDPRMWGLTYHGQPCCRFFLELGPLCIAWHNIGDPWEGDS